MKKIHEKISRLAELAAGWETHEATDPLERDLALELLREIYADIKFAKRASVIEPEREPVAEPEPIVEPAFEPVACAVPEQEPVTEPVIEDEPAPEPVVRAVPEPAAEPEPDTEKEPESLPEPEPAPEAEEVPSRRRRVNQDVIRSLYGDDTPAKKTVKEPAKEPAKEPEQTVKPGPAAEEKPSEAVAKEAPAKETAQGAATLGDVMNSGRQTLGETLKNGNKDMASKIAASERRDLRQSIGINDKFLMIRDMFDGNAAAFSDVIGYLDTFTDLDEAIIYIHETYDWSADSDGVKLLVELLERKLG